MAALLIDQLMDCLERPLDADILEEYRQRSLVVGKAVLVLRGESQRPALAEAILAGRQPAGAVSRRQPGGPLQRRGFHTPPGISKNARPHGKKVKTGPMGAMAGPIQPAKIGEAPGGFLFVFGAGL